jgi:glycosyltransferase 2 family protein
MKRGLRVAIQLALSGALIAYILWQIDVGAALHEIASSNPLYLLAAAALYLSTFWPLAWRWKILLDSKGIHESLGWLTKAYFVGYSVSQVLPTSMGGDAVRIVEHARKRPQAKGEAAGAVLMERAVGAAATLVLVALGFVLAAGRYDNIQGLVKIEFASVIFLVLGGILVFSRRVNTFLQERVFPHGRAVRLQRPMTSLWKALHGYRWQWRALSAVLVLSVALQLVRAFSIWACGEAVGVSLSPTVYIILGPLLFLIMMVPITINGLGVRESFFVFFLGRFGIDADAAFAVGFLFFTVTIIAALPGGVILASRSLRGGLTSVRRREPAPVETGSASPRRL